MSRSSSVPFPAGARLGRGLRGVASGFLIAVVLGCAAPGGPGGDLKDLKTASDQTDADRRAKVRLELASAYFGRGQSATALDEVKLALAARPDLTEALNLRGLIYASMGEARLAEDSFRRALQGAPKDGDVMQNYGWFLCQERRFSEADAQFRQALSQPQYRDTIRTLLAQGVCMARDGKWAQAEASLSRAYEIDPTNPVTAYNLSEVMFRRGEFERARFYLGRLNAQRDLANAQTLWLALRVEHRLANAVEMSRLSQQLRDRFPQSPEVGLLERGRFDD